MQRELRSGECGVKSVKILAQGFISVLIVIHHYIQACTVGT